ncbi:hypothetical protein HNR46_003376 [Haloferula luteola]|uniref:Carbohydrate-binding module family 96 domain-containing protein n=1 Tax=Haloferula luteola TaxID=595692 RepID=A0A840V653_9BACT|nr:hypothetical protein [Haloferula luteola]MBB5353123.1 hypothetical protein [Haloferula luteola]
MKHPNSTMAVVLPALYLLSCPGHAAVSVPTSYGSGADTYLSNDSNSGPTVVHGNGTLNLRYWEATRSRQVLLRYDLGGLEAAADRTSATLSLTFTRSNRGRTVKIYGLRDESLDSWDEATTSYSNAPGALTAATGLFSYDLYDGTTNPSGAWELLGTFVVSNGAVPYKDTSNVDTLPLDSFLASDTNNLISFLVVWDGDNAPDWDIASKENATTTYHPLINLPNATAGDSDGDGLADQWEIDHFGDITSYSGTDDPDSDTYDNEAEETAASDPNDPFSIPGDIDGDELADLWEDQYFGNNDGIPTAIELAIASGNDDPDGDFGSNEDEETAGTDPHNYGYFPLETIEPPYAFLDNENGDGTGDGMNDWWEDFYFGDLTTATDPYGDNDNDGFDNIAEYDAFSDPANPDSFPGDIDADGLNDLWEDRYFGNNDGIVTLDDVYVTDDTEADLDSDGFTNKQEADGTPIGSNPNDAASVPGDADADGLDDQWEIDFFGAIDTQTGSEDSDGDLYTNEEEENAGTDPNDIESFVDSEPDGLNDRWEEQVFGDLTTANDPNADSDSDTYSDFDEYLEGSNPLNPASVPGDIDGDGLADAFEIAYFNSIDLYDGNDDPDRDFATNEEEESATPTETDPSVRTSSPDSDADLLGDAWELYSFGDLTTTELETDDNDSDGYTNAQEYAAASNGNDPLSTPDTDGDGLPEGWERFYFTTETTQTGTTDSDSDGVINLIEYYAGTNPADAGSVPDAGVLTTADGVGADTSLTNDVQNATTGPTVVHGLDEVNVIRDNRASRLHIPMLRFDRSLLTDDLSNAILRIHIPWVSGTAGVINVYGLIDGTSGESWDEATTSYSNAPGILDDQRATLNTWAMNPKQWALLGTMAPTATGVFYSNPANLDLSSFLEKDSDGQITLAFHPTSNNRWHGITAKEQGTDPAPALILPLGSVVSTSSSGPVITHAVLDSVANPQTFTVTVSGLSVGQSYHIQSSNTLSSFEAVSGSTFVAASATQDVPLEVDTAADSRRFVRIAEGAEP